MKIVNWNVGRPSKPKSKLILDTLDELNGDIVILTETNSSITPKGNNTLVATNHQPLTMMEIYIFHTNQLKTGQLPFNKPTNRFSANFITTAKLIL